MHKSAYKLSLLVIFSQKLIGDICRALARSVDWCAIAQTNADAKRKLTGNSSWTALHLRREGKY